LDTGDLPRFRNFYFRAKGARMSVILIFIAFVLIGDTAAIGISYLFERISNFASLLVFFLLYAVVFYIAWKLAVYVTERFILKQTGPAS
jgi:hypothetical protein